LIRHSKQAPDVNKIKIMDLVVNVVGYTLGALALVMVVVFLGGIIVSLFWDHRAEIFGFLIGGAVLVFSEVKELLATPLSQVSFGTFLLCLFLLRKVQT
jgi:hypothetical protein